MPAWLLPAAKIAAPLIGTAIGGLFGGKQADYANQPTTSYQTPNEALGGWENLQRSNQWFTDAANPNNYYTPGEGLQGLAYNNSGGGGGGGMPQAPQFGGGGGGGGGNPAQGLLSAFPGGAGGGNWFDAAQKAGSLMPETTDTYDYYTSDAYRDFQGTPEWQEFQDSVQREADESYDYALGESLSPFATNASLGVGGAALMSRMKGLDEHSENLSNTFAQMNQSELARREGNALQAEALYTETRNQLIQSGLSAYEADKQAAAMVKSALIGGYSQITAADLARQGQIGSASIGAQANIYGDQLDFRSEAANRGLQNKMFGWDKIMDYEDLMRTNWLDQVGVAQNYAGYQNNLHDTWATNYNQGPQMDRGFSQMYGGATGFLGGMEAAGGIEGLVGAWNSLNGGGGGGGGVSGPAA